MSAGFSVQLEHVPAETSWDDTDVHGYVLLKLADGSEICRKGGFQHNRKLRSGGSWDASAVEGVVSEVTSAVKALEAKAKRMPEPASASEPEGVVSEVTSAVKALEVKAKPMPEPASASA